jgi:hypothetical protein
MFRLTQACQELQLKATLSLAWQRFGVLTSIIGDVQGRIIAIGFYFTILVPFGLLSRLFSDPLHLRQSGDEESLWHERHPVPNDIDSARQQG